MLLTILFVAWLAIALVVVAVCRMAARADFARAQSLAQLDERAEHRSSPVAELASRRERRDALKPVA